MKRKILIVGGGPAGAACAIELGRLGISATLFEKFSYGRDKICGDGLLPEAQRALEHLGLREKLLRKAHSIPGIFFFGQRGEKIPISAPFLSLLRRDLDQMIRDKAEEEGAQLIYQADIVNAEIRKEGVAIRDRSGREFEGDVLVLATGAHTTLAEQLGFHFEPYSGVAVRGYMVNTTGLQDAMFWFSRKITTGYAWVFPLNENILNVGVGNFNCRHGKKYNFHSLLKHFLADEARPYVNGANFIVSPQGYPLRMGLKNKPYRNRVLLIGEAAHSTYNFSGEGIGTALISGVLAAQTLAFSKEPYEEDQLAIYEMKLKEKMGSQHKGYTRLKKLQSTRLGSYLVTKLLFHSSSARNYLSEIILGEREPTQLFSVKGVIKILLKGFQNKKIPSYCK